MRFLRVALLITIAAVSLHCSGNPPVSEPGQASLNAPAAVFIQGIDHAATPSGTQVVLHGNYPFNYTSYQPDSRTLIVEVLDVMIDGLADEIEIDTPQIDGIAVSNVQSIDGGNIAKFEFVNVIAGRHAIHMDGNDLILDFPTLSDVDNVPEPPVFAQEEEPADNDFAGAFERGEDDIDDAFFEDDGDDEFNLAEMDSLEDDPYEMPAEDMGIDGMVPIDEPFDAGDEEGDDLKPIDASAEERGSELDEEPANELSDVMPAMTPADTPAPAKTRRNASGLLVVQGPTPSGRLAGKLLSVDTSHDDGALRVVMHADGGLLHEHFELENPMRLVIDLIGVRDETGTRSVPVDSDVIDKVRVAQFVSRPKPVARVVLDMKRPRAYAIVPTENGLVIDFSDQAVRYAAQRPSLIPAAEETRDELTTALATTADDSMPMQEQVAQPLAADAPPVDQMASLELPADIMPDWQDEGPSTLVDARPAEPETVEPQPTEVARAVPPAAGKPDEVSFRPVSRRDSDNTMISRGSSRYGTRSISDLSPKYTGKRISLNFKDADLKDVFRLFHEITGFNIVLDPAVSGKLTIVLDNVPDDQALDIILKNNGLDKVFENNVIRIASTQKLASEAAARKALIEAKELEEEPITFTRSLSYAKSKDVAPIIKKIMSKRGDVIMDERTNTLIITDLRNRQEPINRLIDALDEQTAQVVIEARIVETDREFERDFGITWGIHGTASAAKGTQTNLQFPHNGTIDYDVSLPAAASASTLGISFGNVLDSLTLDATLDAFELNGDVKILSSPRITTQNNQKATIEQGVQIPVVSTTATQINVEFISASLKLEVTPQITKERTIIMDVRVDNSSPDFVNRVGDVPPIITERAETQILVPDGGTAVIGGIFKLNDSVTQAGVPGLSKIPGLGWLFKSKSINRKNTELLIFITPRISAKAGMQEDNG
jgi:type IV pilus assembly protein PilQ